MNKYVLKEIRTFGIAFIVIILFSFLFQLIMPDKVPDSFAIEGIASSWIDKTQSIMHIPIPECLIYLVLTLMQRFHAKNNKALFDYLSQIKLSLILVIGITYPLSMYLYSIQVLSNIWYLVLLLLFSWAVYAYIITIGSGIFLPSKSEKKKKKWLKKKK